VGGVPGLREAGRLECSRVRRVPDRAGAAAARGVIEGVIRSKEQHLEHFK